MGTRKLMAMLGVVLISLATLAALQAKPARAFDQLKMLVGEWGGKTQDDKAVGATYRLVSSGTALLETLNSPDEMEMVTVYTPDGDRLAVTHYCAANNQPRMSTEPITGLAKEFKFAFLGATNLPSAATGHMHGLTVTLEDKDHFTQTWTWRENGHDKTEVFHFTRKK